MQLAASCSYLHNHETGLAVVKVDSEVESPSDVTFLRGEEVSSLLRPAAPSSDTHLERGHPATPQT